ncbi:tetratricopeptide repeat protein [Tepidicaulis sp. LMO-SS28]|uniref:tetratricopeptide repeat protein n=1 Tax=Tepidicaulis sp. LMO-SS28 TaxID=3447455 RepID=UPI003EE0EEEE
MQKDRQGNALSSASAPAAEKYDEAVRAFQIYTGDPVALLYAALEEAPAFTMAHILKAWLMALATEPEATAAAADILAEAKTLPMTDRERSHIHALGLVIQGNWTEAALILDRHNAAWPHDIVAIQMGHQIDFFRASARNLRDRIARVLPKWSPAIPGYGILLGMYAFGLEESGDYARAEAMGREAVDREPLDCWAHHAVAHVMEMEGRAEDGLGWMIAREDHWSGEDNFFKVHNWWHRALFHLGLGQREEALALYDARVRAGRSAIALEMLDASALLWRLHLTGLNLGSRWQELAESWDAHADGRTYPFNDWHAAMAYLGAGREREADRLAQTLRQAETDNEAARWGRQTALPLIEGFTAFWKGDHGTAVEKLHGARFIANSFGGSHAQRDIIDWTLTEAALRGGLKDMGEALAHERLAFKPHNPVNQAFLTRTKTMTAKEKAA